MFFSDWYQDKLLCDFAHKITFFIIIVKKALNFFSSYGEQSTCHSQSRLISPCGFQASCKLIHKSSVDIIQSVRVSLSSIPSVEHSLLKSRFLTYACLPPPRTGSQNWCGLMQVIESNDDDVPASGRGSI